MSGFSIIVFSSVFLVVLIISSLFGHNVFGETDFYIASSRNSFDLNSGNLVQKIEIPSALSILNIGHCPGELAIYVHGVWATEENAEEQTERVFLSIKKAGYNIPLIGYSWDSNTGFSPDDISLSEQGWNVAKSIANSNGPLLGKFISQFSDDCPNDKLRIIAHSLGSRVTLSAIQSLYENSTLADNSKKITSVHLLGAAIDDEQVSLIENQCSENNPPLPCSGKVIKDMVKKFYNLYDPEDNMLAPEKIFIDVTPLNLFDQFFSLFVVSYPSPYMNTENDTPLGAYAIKNKINTPSNYQEYNVLNKILDQKDSDQRNGCDLLINLKQFGYSFGDFYSCTIYKKGDNHFGYLGFRDENDQLQYPGAMSIVVKNWSSEL